MAGNSSGDLELDANGDLAIAELDFADLFRDDSLIAGLSNGSAALPELTIAALREAMDDISKRVAPDAAPPQMRVTRPGIYRAAAQWALFKELAERDAMIACSISYRVGTVAPPATDGDRQMYCEHVGRYMSRREHARMHAEDRRRPRRGSQPVPAELLEAIAAELLAED